MWYIDISGNLPMGIAYPTRPLAEPRSGRYAACESAAGEVFGCIPHGCARAAGVGLPERSEPDGMARPQVASRSEVARGLTARGRARAYLVVSC